MNKILYLNNSISHLNFIIYDFIEDYLISENISLEQFFYDLENLNVEQNILTFIEQEIEDDMNFIGYLFYKFLPYDPEIKSINQIRNEYPFLIKKLKNKINRNLNNDEISFCISKWGKYYILEFGILF
jgi:hypothetical protein